MIARASQLFLPTLREAPADAEAASHQLLVRGGFIRQIGAGLWAMLPLGWRVHMRIERIIREEINAIGGQEMRAPTLTPAELWETTGRIDVPILFHLNDSGGRKFVLSWTHEESMTFLGREIQSYKQLPQVWYHFSTKDRDEQRPRGGLLRLREFIMKDSYTFDADEAGLDAAFDRHAQAYARIFERCGLEAYLVEAESGTMGGKESSGFLAPTGSGENELMRCENDDYFADVEAARGTPRPPDLPPPLDAPELVDTPGVTTIEEVAKLLGIAESATSKALPVVTGDRLVLALVRGDDRLSPEKLETLFEAAFRPATDDEIRAAFGAGGGSLGPVGVDVEVIADEALRDGQYVAGANEDGRHLRGVQAGRDYEPTFADIRQAKDGDACPECGGTLRVQTAIEVGHIFKLGTFHSKAFGATFLDEDGQEKPLVMGSYGIGLARTMAAIVEQCHDENGIVWPRAVAPYDAHVVVLPGAEEIAERAAEALSAAGLEVLLDDRDQRAGEKFADADLIGCPIRVTAGRKSLEDGKVDVRNRASGAENRLDVADLGKEA
ncbi:MAG TPA: proline--tRNA ligase [Gaiellaceae bacterium]|jgi:prolyl-tRNA synthetase|nr:proline--tRNA ligase [Gaiellaceae bacterium]